MRACDRYIGEKHISNQGCNLTVFSYEGNGLFTVQLDSGRFIKNLRIEAIRKGEVKNPYHPSVCEIGYIGEGIYSTRNRKIYRKWYAMFDRCYGIKKINFNRSYKGCTVDERWHNFQNFAEWYEENHKSYMDRWQLDKDILIKGNKIYSPETCCFVPVDINRLLVINSRDNGLPLGVYKHYKKYKACMGYLHIGVYNTPEEAFEAYKTTKESHIKDVADRWKDKITEQTYQALISYKIEIND